MFMTMIHTDACIRRLLKLSYYLVRADDSMVMTMIHTDACIPLETFLHTPPAFYYLVRVDDSMVMTMIHTEACIHFKLVYIGACTLH